MCAITARSSRFFAISAILISLAACGKVEDPTLFPEFDPENAAPIMEKPLVPSNPDRNVFWGDLHIHTSISNDAFTMGTKTLPEQVYVFAKGGEIEHALGYGVKIGRPLDFAAVTDHSEYLGLLRVQDPDVAIKRRDLRTRLLEDSPLRTAAAIVWSLQGFTLEVDGIDNPEAVSKSAWRQIIDTAERHNDPGRFTTFVGYEWTSMPDERNLHRVVIYGSNKVPDLPYSSVDSEDPRDLWTALEKQRESGMPVLAIPHNGNVSGGLMYAKNTLDGGAMDAEYARRRMLNEPLSEIFQVKGSSETHPLLSSDDEFAGFELYENLLSTDLVALEPSGGYIREALRVGLEMSHSEGFNPYRFGVIGSTDSHNASSPIEEYNYHGKLPMMDGSAGIRLGKSITLPEERQITKKWSAAGLAAVWAEENTRESLFAAMRRKETYATSGPRITVRFYGAWDFPETLFSQSDRVGLARASGVPMGGDLIARDDNGQNAPQFAVWATKDPENGNLDRIQIIKGWVDKNGQSHEKIFDVALSDGRQQDPVTGKIPPVGNTVDVDQATYTNTIGDVQLEALWTDPEFDASQEAFYYARVIEIPTPRWSTYDAKQLGVEAPQPTSIQERAVTSSIWYRPTSSLPK